MVGENSEMILGCKVTEEEVLKELGDPNKWDAEAAEIYSRYYTPGYKGSKMNNQGLEFLRDLGSNAPRIFIYSTGAGAGIQKEIWEIPGCSNFLIGCGFPYESEVTSKYLGIVPEKFVSTDTALELAMAAYLQAAKPGFKNIGIGLTASVASTSEHRGAHRVAVASISESECLSFITEIPKGSGQDQRIIDGDLADRIGIQSLLRAAGVDLPYIKIVAKGGKTLINYEPINSADQTRECLKKKSCFLANGQRIAESEIKTEEVVFFPGSFNPFHFGHENSANAFRQEIAKKFGVCRDIIYTTTVDSLHKAPLTISQMLDKVAMMRNKNFCLTFNDPFFIDKARKHPGAWFGLGADALLNMLDPKWGCSSRDVILEFQKLNIKIFVLGRLVKDKFVTLSSLKEIYPELNAISSYNDDIFVEIPGRWDISSTELRNNVQ